MPPKSKKSKKSKKQSKLRSNVKQKILETDVETKIAQLDQQTNANKYQLDADEFEETFGLLNVEDEYEEVGKKNVYGGGRATRGCNVWKKGMDVVYSRTKPFKFLYGKVVSSTKDSVIVYKYKKGVLTREMDEWDCKYLSEDKTSEGRNRKAGLKMKKRATFKVKKTNKVKNVVEFMRKATDLSKNDRHGRDVSQQAAMMLKGISGENDPCRNLQPDRVTSNTLPNKKACEKRCEEDNRSNDKKECCKTKCPQEGLDSKLNPTFGMNQNVGKTNLAQPPMKINRRRKLQEDKYGYDLKF